MMLELQNETAKRARVVKEAEAARRRLAEEIDDAARSPTTSLMS